MHNVVLPAHGRFELLKRVIQKFISKTLGPSVVDNDSRLRTLCDFGRRSNGLRLQTKQNLDSTPRGTVGQNRAPMRMKDRCRDDTMT